MDAQAASDLQTSSRPQYQRASSSPGRWEGRTVACGQAAGGAAGTVEAADPSSASDAAGEELLTRPVSACADAGEAASWTGT